MGRVKTGMLIAAFAGVAVCGALGIKSHFFSGSSQPPSPVSASVINQDMHTLQHPGNLPHTTTLPGSFSGAAAIVTIGGDQPVTAATTGCPGLVSSYDRARYLVDAPGPEVVDPAAADTTLYVEPNANTNALLSQFAASAASQTGKPFLLVVDTAGKVKGFLAQANACGITNITPSTLVIVAGAPFKGAAPGV